jgi:hypothetical protein
VETNNTRRYLTLGEARGRFENPRGLITASAGQPDIARQRYF